MKRIREHPNIKWPPEPTGAEFGQGESFLPSRKGILKEVRPARHATDADVELILEHQGKSHHAWIQVRNGAPDFASKLRDLLSECIGLSVDEIGEKEIAD